MRIAVASLVLALSALFLGTGCSDEDPRVAKTLHLRLYVDGVGDFGCEPTQIAFPDQVVMLSCDADGLTLTGEVDVDPAATVVGIVTSETVDVLDRYIEVPAGYEGAALWATVRIEERYHSGH